MTGIGVVGVALNKDYEERRLVEAAVQALAKECGLCRLVAGDEATLRLAARRRVAPLPALEEALAGAVAMALRVRVRATMRMEPAGDGFELSVRCVVLDDDEY